MKTHARILVATDLGVAGDQAIETGAAWSRRYSGTLIVAHVARAGAEAAARIALDERVRAVTQQEGVELRVVQGATADSILAVAEEVSADMIVLGGRERSGLRWVFGAVAERVVARSPVPVLVARAEEERAPHILAATDFSEPSLPAVAAARQVAHELAAPVTIVHCIERDAAHSGIGALTSLEGADPEVLAAARTRLRELCEQSPEKDTSRVLVGDPARSIVDLAEQIKASLVVVASRGRSGVARFVLGSVASRVVRDAPCSVLVVRLR